MQVVPGHVGMAVVGHVRHADQVRRRLPDGPGVRRAPAVRGTAAGRRPQLHRARGRDVHVPVPGRRFVRQRAVPGHGGRPAAQPGRQFRLPRRRHGVQRAAVRGPVAVLHQGQVPGVMRSACFPRASVRVSADDGTRVREATVSHTTICLQHVVTLLLSVLVRMRFCSKKNDEAPAPPARDNV